MLSIDKERAQRLSDLKNNGGNARYRLLTELKNNFSNDDYRDFISTLEFVDSADYQHGGLTKEAYLAHPYRTAILAMTLVDPIDKSLVELALIHNLLEVSSLDDDKIAARFGDKRLNELKALTIDRSQNSKEYSDRYYHGIWQSSSQSRMMKVIDKLDNLYMLCLNPDSDIRDLYLREVKEQVLPLAAKEIPHIVQYLNDLIDNCYYVGYQES